MLTYRQVDALIERGPPSVTVPCRRQILIELAERAQKSRGHTPVSRARLRAFRAALDSFEANDEVEVCGETLLEVAMYALETL